MFCEVIELRNNGLRLRPEEWPAPVAGQLRMAQWDSKHTSYHRAIRKLVDVVGMRSCCGAMCCTVRMGESMSTPSFGC